MMWVARSKLLSPLVKSENEHNAGIVKGGWSGVVSYITWRSGGVSHLFTFCGRTTPLNRFNGWAKRQGWAFMIRSGYREAISSQKCIMHVLLTGVGQHSVGLTPTKTYDIAGRGRQRLWPERNHKRRLGG